LRSLGFVCLTVEEVAGDVAEKAPGRLASASGAVVRSEPAGARTPFNR
jgi:hypothetical protein